MSGDHPFFVDPYDQDEKVISLHLAGGHHQGFNDDADGEELDDWSEAANNLSQLPLFQTIQDYFGIWYDSLDSGQQQAVNKVGIAIVYAASMAVAYQFETFTTRKLWKWHIEPLGVRPITKREALGVALLASFASGAYEMAISVKEKPAEGWVERRLHQTWNSTYACGAALITGKLFQMWK